VDVLHIVLADVCDRSSAYPPAERFSRPAPVSQLPSGEAMNWTPVGESKRCISSDEGYLVSKYALPAGPAYVARTPAPSSKILYSGEHAEHAKAACVDHFESAQGKAA
jgi:hypothetical protein